MKKLMICLAVLLTGCTSQAAAAMAPAMNRTEKNEVIPESDDFFDSSVNEEQDKTAEPAPAVQPAVPAEPPVTQSPAEDPEPGQNYGFNTAVSPDDFAFYTSVVYDGVPDDAEYPPLKYAEGAWKYYLSDTSVSEDGTFFEQYGYADLALDRENNLVIVTLHPRLGGDGFELYDILEDPGYEPFSGGLTEEGALKLIGNETVLYITYYYAWQGRECIAGDAWFSEEDQGMFIMTRGQE
ncbi:MAG: hypothetical protein IIY72_08115 [Solobacterium sp.]|nr:hypothetical protein [Solobacterium sp.]MBQ1321545.1 hypothetical protein [Solobacterium sp.]MBQ1356428.1 hypothetical protein [Solobacterium sp.]MBR0214663.1 hypothetical protein [Solobacterium sp.]